MSQRQLGGIEELNLSDMRAPSVEEARRLTGCLELCDSLEVLRMSTCRLDDAACVAIFSSLATGALPRLTVLYVAQPHR